MPETPLLLTWKTRLLTWLATVLTNASIRHDGTVNAVLLFLFDPCFPPNPTPIHGVYTSDHAVDLTRNLKIRLFSTSVLTSNQTPAIVYFHGAGLPSPVSMTPSAAATSLPTSSLSNTAFPLSITIPPHTLMVPMLSTFSDSSDLIPDLSSVFIAGDSAGGNIAHHKTRSLTSSPPLFKRLSLSGLVAIQPFFGGEEDRESEKQLEGLAPFAPRERYKWMWRSFLPIGSSLSGE